MMEDGDTVHCLVLVSGQLCWRLVKLPLYARKGNNNIDGKPLLLLLTTDTAESPSYT